MIHIRVPATTANLGPGFDCLGMAVSLYGDFYFEERGEGFYFENVEKKYQNENNLAVKAYDYALSKIGEKREKGLYVKIVSQIPAARGLGSSAALIAAGIEAAVHIHGYQADMTEKLQWAAELEGHPDNAAPAFKGGLTACMTENSKVWCTSYPVSEKVKCCVLIPSFSLSTREARKALPEAVKLSDAVFNISHTVHLLKALETGNMAYISAALDDRLHVQYREKLIFGGEEIRKAALDAGAAACTVSGAGPTLLCLYEKDDFLLQIRKVLKNQAYHWEAVPVNIDTKGIAILEE